MPPTETVTGPSAPAESKGQKRTRKSAKPASGAIEAKHAIEEIEAYITIRDGLLAEAEKNSTSELLRRVSTANDFVENCLQPVKSLYEAQSFPKIDAIRERERCESVKKRIAQLGGQSGRDSKVL
jgi:hypothetical protein